MGKLILNLVHFNRQPCTGHVRDIVAKVKLALMNEFQISILETEFQNEKAGYKQFIELYKIEFFQASFEFKYHFFSQKRKNLTVNAGELFKQSLRNIYSLLLKTFVFIPKSLIFKRDSLIRRQQIETLLTLKHLYGWLAVLNSDSDGIVCFEDDVILGIDGNLDYAIQLISKKSNLHIRDYGEKSIYFDFIDLAGGFTFDQMRIRQNSESGYEYEGIIGNTTCSYFASHRLVKRLVADILANPKIINLGVGFVLNRSDMHLGSNEFKSFLPIHTPFKHGSLSGAIASSIPRR